MGLDCLCLMQCAVLVLLICGIGCVIAVILFGFGFELLPDFY